MGSIAEHLTRLAHSTNETAWAALINLDARKHTQTSSKHGHIDMEKSREDSEVDFNTVL